MNATTTAQRQEITYNKVVNISNDGEITLLHYVFDNGAGFKGATGTTFSPVSLQEYKERTSKDEVINQIIDCGIPKGFEREGANGVYKVMKANNEIQSFVFDTSYSELWDMLRKECKLNKTKAYIFECTGGGRCFDNKFQGNVNPELSELIRKYESE